MKSRINSEKPHISIIVAVSKEWAIGRENKLLWHIPQDLQYFKSVTQGHTVVMGRKTWDSIGRPLPNRRNIVISRSTTLTLPNTEIYPSINEGIAAAKESEKEEIFIIGGGSIYSQALDITTRLYLTIVDQSIPNADTFFPKIDFSQWEIVQDEMVEYGRRMLLVRSL
ncbi:MAG: dihydrofolate reductase [Bacteroidales bacterium]